MLLLTDNQRQLIFIIMTSITAELLIHKDPAVFRPGEAVDGCLVVSLRESTALSKIRVRLFGEALEIRKNSYGKEIAVDHAVAQAEHDETASFGDSKVYIDQVQTLWGNGE